MTILAVFAKKVAFVFNVPLLYSRYGTGNSLQLRLMQGIFSNANNICLFLMIFPRMSLHSKLVPVQYREHEYGLLSEIQASSYHGNWLLPQEKTCTQLEVLMLRSPLRGAASFRELNIIHGDISSVCGSNWAHNCDLGANRYCDIIDC